MSSYAASFCRGLAALLCATLLLAAASGAGVIRQRWVPTVPLGGGTFQGVSCPSATACVAVGTSPLGAGTLAALFDGVHWSSLPTPSVGSEITSGLASVSCVSSKLCVAAGASSGIEETVTLVERWDGTQWSVESIHQPGYLTGVSCGSAQTCIAVGSRFVSFSSATSSTSAVMEVWNGVDWSVGRIARRPGWADTSLQSVSCRSADSCTAVGYFNVGSGCSFSGDPCHVGALVEHWDGYRWSIQSVPTLPGWRSDSLEAISCSSSRYCFAIGTLSDMQSTVPFAASWDGRRWSSQLLPKPPNRIGATTAGLSCSSRRSCAAVLSFTGFALDPGPTDAERWNGSRWSIQEVPLPAHVRHAFLGGVSCTSSSECIAVGAVRISGGRMRPLVERLS